VFVVELGHSPYWNFFRTWRHERLGAGWTDGQYSVHVCRKHALRVMEEMQFVFQTKSALVTLHWSGTTCLNIKNTQRVYVCRLIFGKKGAYVLRQH